MSAVNRREFVVAAVGVMGAACAGCLCGSADAAPAPTSQRTGPVDVGTKADYPKDGILNDKFRLINFNARQHAALKPLSLYRQTQTHDELNASDHVYDQLTRFKFSQPTNRAAAANE